MTKIQNILIVIGSAILFQVATLAAGTSAADFADWRHWLVGAAVGVVNSAGVAVLALYTAGGLTFPGRGDGATSQRPSP